MSVARIPAARALRVLQQEPPHGASTPLPALMTMAEAGAYLRLSPETLAYKTHRTRELPFVRLFGPRGPIRFKKADLDALIEAGYIRAEQPLRSRRRAALPRAATGTEAPCS